MIKLKWRIGAVRRLFRGCGVQLWRREIVRKWTLCGVLGVALLFSCAGLASAQDDGDGIMPPLPQSVFGSDGESVKVQESSDVGADSDAFSLPETVRIHEEEPSPATEDRTDAEHEADIGAKVDESEALPLPAKANRSRADNPSPAPPKAAAKSSERLKEAADNSRQPSASVEEEKHRAAGVRGGQFGKPFRVSHGSAAVKSASHAAEAKDDEDEVSSSQASPAPSDNQVVKFVPASSQAEKDAKTAASSADHKPEHHMKGSSIQPRGGNVRVHQAKPKPSHPDDGAVMASRGLPKVNPSTPVPVTRESISDIVGEELRTMH